MSILEEWVVYDNALLTLLTLSRSFLGDSAKRFRDYYYDDLSVKTIMFSLTLD